MKRIWLLILPLTAAALLLRFLTYTHPENDLMAPLNHCLPKGTPLVDSEGFQIVNPGPSCEVLKSINQEYLRVVKPIFTQKCLMCHADSGGQTHPLYVVVPPTSWMVTRDIREARKKMDMTFDFPFQGHGSPPDDLQAVHKVVEKGSMPPLKFKMLHWQSGLTIQEQEAVKEWVQNSLKQLNKE